MYTQIQIDFRIWTLQRKFLVEIISFKLQVGGCSQFDTLKTPWKESYWDLSCWIKIPQPKLRCTRTLLGTNSLTLDTFAGWCTWSMDGVELLPKIWDPLTEKTHLKNICLAYSCWVPIATLVAIRNEGWFSPVKLMPFSKRMSFHKDRHQTSAKRSGLKFMSGVPSRNFPYPFQLAHQPVFFWGLVISWVTRLIH